MEVRDGIAARLQISEQLLSRNVERFRGGLALKAHGLLYHSALGSRVIKKKDGDLGAIVRDRPLQVALVRLLSVALAPGERPLQSMRKRSVESVFRCQCPFN